MPVARDEDAITQTFTEYAHAFQSLDSDAASSYFHVPCMVISAEGVLVMATPAEVQAFFNRMMDGLKARGYARSEIRSLHAKQVGASIALLSVSRVRYKTNGDELGRLGETYTFRKTDDGWKIVVAAIHDPDAVVRLT